MFLTFRKFPALYKAKNRSKMPQKEVFAGLTFQKGESRPQRAKIALKGDLLISITEWLLQPQLATMHATVRFILACSKPGTMIFTW